MTEKWNDDIFRNPTAEYRGIPFWSWNCKVTEELIDWQLDCFAQMGFGGVDIHPRTGLDIEYLGDEYMRLIKHTVERCKEKGLLCWLYDEDRFPSGVAGGKVTRDFRLRGRYLLLTERRVEQGILPGYCEDRVSFEAAVDRGEKPTGYYATAYGLLFDQGYLKEYRRLCSREEIDQALERGERVRFAYVKIMEEEQWFENQTYVDTMNPEATARFIRLTHEAYYEKVGDEFGKAVPAIFTDEPRIGNHGQISRALSSEDVTVPYTDYLAEEMKRKYGIDPLDIAPEYVWEMAPEKHSGNRYLYRETAAECFAGAYMDRLSDWCGEHGIAMTGHVLSEESLNGQSITVGDCMRCYRKMDLPGIDILVDNRELTTARQAVSVARQKGRAGTVSELYGVTHWDCDFVTFKLQGDWQAALGITIRVPHLSHMSLKGEAKRDWPGSIFYQSPWYREFSYVEDHFARLNTALTRGRAVVKIAVVHPVESMWLYFGPDDQTAEIRREMDGDFQNLAEWLLYGLMDFDFLAESLLAELCGEEQPRGALRAGCMTYSAVVVPGLKTVRASTLDILEAFCDRGGKIIFMGRVPDFVDARKSERARMLAERCICIPGGRHELLNALEEERVLDVRKQSGRRADNLFYQMREDGDSRWLYLCHVNRKDSHISSPELYEVQIKGKYEVTLYDTLSGEIGEIAAEQKSGYTVLTRSMYGEDSILLKLDSRAAGENMDSSDENVGSAAADTGKRVGTRPESASGEPRYEIVERLERADSFRRSEPNVLLLDYAQVQLDDDPLQQREEMLRADNNIRRQLGFVLRQDQMNQPWFLEEKETHKVTVYCDFLSEIETKACLALEDIEHSRVTLNGKPANMEAAGYYVDPDISCIELPTLQKGVNHLEVEVAYHQKSGLENMFVLGDFDVELRGSRAVIREQRQEIGIGDITAQGMPFYTGNLEYIFRFEAGEDGSYSVHIPHFKSPVLAVYLDGEKRGLIAYAPNRLNLGKMCKGWHELKILLYGNRFNGFGTLHNANENYVWYGPDSYRTEGDDWTDCYLVRPVGIMAAVEVEKIL